MFFVLFELFVAGIAALVADGEVREAASIAALLGYKIKKCLSANIYAIYK